MTVSGLLGETQLDGNPRKGNYRLVIDAQADKNGIGAELSAERDSTVLLGLASKYTFGSFASVSLLFGSGDDSLLLHATPLGSFDVNFGRGKNEIEVDLEKLSGTGDSVTTLFRANTMQITSLCAGDTPCAYSASQPWPRIADTDGDGGGDGRMRRTGDIDGAATSNVTAVTSNVTDYFVFKGVLDRVDGVVTTFDDTHVEMGGFRIDHEGVAEAQFALGDKHELHLDQTQAQLVSLDNVATATVFVTASSICDSMNDPAVGVRRTDSVDLQGDQLLRLDLSVWAEGSVSVIVDATDIIVSLHYDSGLDTTKKCTIPLAFSRSVELTLTAKNDDVTILSLATDLAIRAEGGDDTVVLHTTNRGTKFDFHGGGGKNVVRTVGHDHAVLGEVRIKAAGAHGRNTMTYHLANRITWKETATPGLVEVASTNTINYDATAAGADQNSKGTARQSAENGNDRAAKHDKVFIHGFDGKSNSFKLGTDVSDGTAGCAKTNECKIETTRTYTKFSYGENVDGATDGAAAGGKLFGLMNMVGPGLAEVEVAGGRYADHIDVLEADCAVSVFLGGGRDTLHVGPAQVLPLADANPAPRGNRRELFVNMGDEDDSVYVHAHDGPISLEADDEYGKTSTTATYHDRFFDLVYDPVEQSELTSTTFAKNRTSPDSKVTYVGFEQVHVEFMRGHASPHNGALRGEPDCVGDAVGYSTRAVAASGHAYGDKDDKWVTTDCLVSSTSANAHTRVKSNGGREIRLEPAQNITGKAVVLQGLPTDTVVVSAREAEDGATCDIEPHSITAAVLTALDVPSMVAGAVSPAGTPMALLAPLDVRGLSMPVGTVTVDNFGAVTVIMAMGHKNTATVHATNDDSTTNIFGGDQEDKMTAHAMGQRSCLRLFANGGADNLHCSPKTEPGELDPVELDQVHLHAGNSGKSGVNVTVYDRFHLQSFGHGSYDLSAHGGTKINNKPETKKTATYEARLIGTADRDDYLLRRGHVYQMNDPGVDEDTVANNVEVVRYAELEVERLRIFARDGPDRIVVDCTGPSMLLELRGGDGDDMFVFGQVYNSDRDGEARLSVVEQGQVDVLRTDLGYLSTGNQGPVSAYGMDGADRFYVQSNDGELQLTGDAGNDYFSVRSFSLSEERDDEEPLYTLQANASNRTTFVNGSKGDDYVQYDKNAATGIDGGEGFNTLVV